MGTIIGTAGDDTLNGTIGNDLMEGGAGQDRLVGLGGADTLDGGPGRDTLIGGPGANVYCFGLGDGQDTIFGAETGAAPVGGILRFKAGVTPSMVTIRQSSTSSAIELLLTGTTDTIQILNFLLGALADGSVAFTEANLNNPIARIEFDDGTAWDLSTIKALAMTGGAGDDTISGTIQADTLSGNAGRDRLSGRGGADVLLGGSGSDSLYGELGDDTLDGGADVDQLFGQEGEDRLSGGLGNDFLSGGADHDELDGGDGSDSITGDEGRDTLRGGAGQDTLDGGLDDDQLLGGDGPDRLIGLDGADALAGDAGDDTLIGSAGHDSLFGGLDADQLFGGVGDDHLDGGAGPDTLEGGPGTNVFHFGLGDGQDTVRQTDAGTEAVINILRFKSGITPSMVSLRQALFPDAALVVVVGSAADEVRLSSFLNEFSSAGEGAGQTVTNRVLERIEFADGSVWNLAEIRRRMGQGSEGANDLVGTDLDDTLRGGGGPDTLSGGLGADLLDGGPGDDVLKGGPGSDTLDGGLGNDLLEPGVAARSTGLPGAIAPQDINVFVFGLGDGQDTIAGFNPSSIPAPGEVTNVSGVLRFKAGITPGMVQPSILAGSETQVILRVAGAGDSISIDHFATNGASPVTRVEFADGTVWSAEQILQFLMTGTAGADNLLGSALPDTIRGLEGHDTIDGRSGADLIFGGAGNDRLFGGMGANTIFGGDGQDSIFGIDRQDVLHGEGGDDSIQGAGLIFGGDGRDTLEANGVATLDGGAGADVMRSFFPAVFVVDSHLDVVRGNSAQDTVRVLLDWYKVPVQSGIDRAEYAPGVMPLPYWIDALTSEPGYAFNLVQRSSKVIHYGFPQSIQLNLFEYYGQLPAAHQQAVRGVLARIAEVIDVRFVETTDEALLVKEGNLKIWSITNAFGAPSSARLDGLVVVENTDPNSFVLTAPPDPALYAQLVGVALGLGSPRSVNAATGPQFPLLPAVENTTTWTVLGRTGTPAPDLFGPLDMAALAHHFGISPAYRPGADNYVLTADRPHLISDGGGVDTLDAREQSLPLTLHLTPGYQGYLGALSEMVTAPGQIVVNFGTLIENAFGGSAADRIWGNAQSNRLAGMGGDDALDGGGGVDQAVFTGLHGQYRITLNRSTGVTQVADRITGRDGADTLRSIESLRFADADFALVNAPRTQPPKYNTNPSFLFDAAYYVLANHSAVPGLNMAQAADHYQREGAAKGFQPTVWFDPAYYANRWSDLKALNLSPDILFAHYNLYGVWEGRSAGPIFDRFDGERYLRDNPDVASYVDAFVNDFLGSRTNGAIAHYIIYGTDEGRRAFDTTGSAIEQVAVIGTPTP